jgi:hypothetical protein
LFDGFLVYKAVEDYDLVVLKFCSHPPAPLFVTIWQR